MKDFKHFITGLVIYFILMPFANQAAEIFVDKNSDLTRIVIGAQDMLVVTLTGIPSSGYEWMTAQLDRSKIQDLSGILTNRAGSSIAEYEAGPDDPGIEKTQILRFVGLDAGISSIVLEYQRPWLKNKTNPEKRFTIQVQSTGAYSGSYHRPVQHFESQKRLSPEQWQTPALPSRYNWVDSGWVTAVKDQKSSGFCWAFATCAVSEAHIKRKTGLERDFAEQYLGSCNPWGMSSNMGGYSAFPLFIDFFQAGETGAGAVYEADFPCIFGDMPCNPPHPHFEQLDGWGYIDGVEDTPWPGKKHRWPTPAELKQIIYDRGPIWTSVYYKGWSGGYTGGVWNAIAPDSSGGHAVVITGWDDSASCFYIKNSWGADWGEKGYIRIAYGTGNLGRYATYAMIKSNPRLTYNGSVFYEKIANNGQIDNSLNIKLTDGGTAKFSKSSGDYVSGTHYSVLNVPAGLSLLITATSETSVSVKLTGTASAHEKSNSIKNLTLTFLDAAFTNATAGNLFNASRTDLGVSFFNSWKIVYKDINPDPVVTDTVESGSYQRIIAENASDVKIMFWQHGTDTSFKKIVVLTWGEKTLNYSTDFNGHAVPIPTGTVIGPSSKYWCENGDYMDDTPILVSKDYTGWCGKTANLGLQLSLNGYPVFGWLRMEVTADGKYVKLLDFAYNEEPNSPIIAGKTDTVVAGNKSPVAKTNGPLYGIVNSSLTFNASNSSDPDGTISDYQWHFKDGAVNNAMTTSHSFTKIGFNPVDLIVVDNQGASAFTTTFAGIRSEGIPEPWINQTVNEKRKMSEGNVTFQNSAFSINGCGNYETSYGSYDGFYYVFQQLKGNGSIVARLVSYAPSFYLSWAGAMMRTGPGDGSEFAKLAIVNRTSQGNYAYFDVRNDTWTNNTQESQPISSVPCWIKVQRANNNFSGYISQDGKTWTQVGTTQHINVQNNLPENIWTGLCVSSGKDSVLMNAVFDNVVVTNDPVGLINNINTTEAGFIAVIANLRNNTVIQYNLSTADKTSLIIYNSLGKIVRNLLDEKQNAGIHTVVWNNHDSRGCSVAKGIYFCALKTGKNRIINKILIYR